MAKMIQVRHVPEDIHRRLTNRAREQRMSLSDYLLAELQHTSEQPSRAEILGRLSRLRPVASRAAIVHAVRSARAKS
jgi:antitoxin FitA